MLIKSFGERILLVDGTKQNCKFDCIFKKILLNMDYLIVWKD